ncbi:MAG: PmoA family protein [Cyclobacteriaceae bacterium]
MIHRITIVLVILLSGVAQAQSLTFEYGEEGVWVKEGNEKVLFFQQKTRSQDGKYPRADYIHPLYGLDGTVLTEDFPEDHLHHRGIFWAWHQVIIGDQRMGDAWECKDFVWDVQEVNGKQEDSALHAKTFWKSPLWTNSDGAQEPFLSEETKVTVHPKTPDYRVIDFEISLLALVPDLKIGGSEDVKGYSGFSVRMKLPEDIEFTSTQGKVTPTTEAVEAGPWINMSGSLAADGGHAGIVIMNHPQNPPPENQWILRNSASMQNPVYPGRHPVPVSDKTPTVLRYRLLVYQGALSEEKLNQIYNGWQ